MNKKVLVTVGLIGALIPLNAKALTGSVDLNCAKTTLAPGETTTCTIKGNINEGVSAVSIKLNAGSNLTLSNINPDSSWQGDGEGGNIDLYTDSNKTGNFSIATFNVKSADITNGASTNITLSDVKLSDAGFAETPFTVAPLNIRIPSTINTLSSLKIDGANIEGFSSTKVDYSLTVDSSKTSINIDAVATDSHTTITGDTSSKNLKYGANKFSIKAKSEIGTAKVYNLIIVRPEVRELKTLTINDKAIDLSTGLYEYKYTVDNKVTTADLKAILNDEDAANFVENFGERKVEELKEGNNEILIKIKDNNNEELVYKLTINRLNKKGEDITEDGSDKTDIENPKTGVRISIFINIVFILVFGVGLLWVYRKNYFKQI